MSLEEFYYVSQIIASIGVLASVIYLALQTRQTARNQKTALHQNRAIQFSNEFGRLTDPALAAVVLEADTGQETLDDVKFLQYRQLWLTALIGLEEQFRLYREGNFDAMRWQSTTRGFPIMFAQPGGRAMVRMFQMIADKEFSAVLDKAMIEARAMPKVDFKAIWLALAADERTTLSGGAASAS